MSANNTVPLDRAILEARNLYSATAPREDFESETRGAPLRAVEPTLARRARRKPGALVWGLTTVALVLAIMGTQLGLSIVVSRGAYESRALEVEQRDLIRVERVLSQNLNKLASPQNLAENAAALGMVQNSTPATLRVSDGTISGDLAPRTSEVAVNLIANATLTNLPVVDAEGLLVSRNEGLAAVPEAQLATTPVAWEGKLPAPSTH